SPKVQTSLRVCSMPYPKLEFSPLPSIVMRRDKRGPVVTARSVVRIISRVVLKLFCHAPVHRISQLLFSSLRNGVIWIAIIFLFANGCATPVGVERVDEQDAHRELNANILSTDKPSEYSTQMLERNALAELYHDDPQRALGELYSGLGKPDER